MADRAWLHFLVEVSSFAVNFMIDFIIYRVVK